VTLTTTTSRTSYAGSGTTGPFAVPFRFVLATDLLVTRRDAGGGETTLVNVTDYAVSGAGNATGSVTLVTALATGETLVIRRAVSKTQPVSLANGGTYFGATHEAEFDRLTMQIQDLQDQASRAFGLSESYAPGALECRVPVPLPNQVLTANGNATAAEWRTVDTASAALVPGGGRTVASLTDYLANNAPFNPLDYGAAGNGVADDTDALATCDAACVAAAGVMALPAGQVFRVAGALTLASPLVLLGGVLTPDSGVTLTVNGTIDGRPVQAFDCTAGGTVLFGDAINQGIPEWFGAIGGGIADCSAALRALVVAFNGDGATIEFTSRGGYLFASTVGMGRCNLRGVAFPANAGGGTRLTFTGTAGMAWTSDTLGIQIEDLRIGGATAQATNGQVLVDLSGCAHARLRNVVVTTTDIGIRLANTAVEANYCTFEHVNVFRCTLGVDHQAGNSLLWQGGRFNDCTTGYQIASGLNNIAFVGAWFECGDTPNVAVDSTGINVTFVGCRFETLGKDVVVRSGAGEHWFFGCHHSSGTDISDANVPGVCFGLSTLSGSEGTILPVRGAGANRIVNGRGVWGTGGWSRTHSSGSGDSLTHQTGDATVGDFLRLTNASAASNPRAYQVPSVLVGKRMVVSCKYRTTMTIAQIRVGTGGTSDSTYVLSNCSSDGAWHEVRFAFTPTTTTVNVSFYINGTANGDLDFTDAMLTAGYQAPAVYAAGGVDELGGHVFGALALDAAAVLSDTTAARPASPVLGQMYFDTTLGEPLWYNGSNWVLATGVTA
jgi:hypothetical protein